MSSSAVTSGISSRPFFKEYSKAPLLEESISLSSYLGGDLLSDGTSVLPGLCCFSRNGSSDNLRKNVKSDNFLCEPRLSLND